MTTFKTYSQKPIFQKSALEVRFKFWARILSHRLFCGIYYKRHITPDTAIFQYRCVFCCRYAETL